MNRSSRLGPSAISEAELCESSYIVSFRHAYQHELARSTGAIAFLGAESLCLHFGGKRAVTRSDSRMGPLPPDALAHLLLVDGTPS